MLPPSPNVIFGTGHRIGQEIASVVGANGSDVAICNINEEGLAVTSKLLKVTEVNIFSKVVNIFNEGEIVDFVRAAADFMEFLFSAHLMNWLIKVLF